MLPGSKVTPRFLTASVGKIELGWKFLDEGLFGLSITNDNEFCFLWIEFQFHTIHPLLNTGETFSELSKTGINWSLSIWIPIEPNKY